jgi:hypothetical protein
VTQRYKTINALLSTPEHNFFSLVRDPAQTTFDLRSTTPPIPSSFETGFLGYERTQIREFVAEENLSLPAKCSWIVPDMYALLDEISLDGENTVVLGTALSSIHDRDPGAMTKDEKDQWILESDQHDLIKDMWREFRVTFAEAEQLSTVLTFEKDFTQKLYNDAFVAKYTDERGVFHVARAQLAFETSHHDEL